MYVLIAHKFLPSTPVHSIILSSSIKWLSVCWMFLNTHNLLIVCVSLQKAAVLTSKERYMTYQERRKDTVRQFQEQHAEKPKLKKARKAEGSASFVLVDQTDQWLGEPIAQDAAHTVSVCHIQDTGRCFRES